MDLSEETRRSNNIHVLLVSFPGQGHLTPLLRLGKRLASSGLFVTVSTPELIGQSIRKTNNITDNDNPTPVGKGTIRFEFFDDGWDHPNKGVKLDEYLAKLELTGRSNLPLMIQKHAEMGRPVSCIINDPYIPWVTDVAESLGIPSAMLWVQSCATFMAYHHYYHKLAVFPSEHEPEIDVQLPCMPLLKHDEVPSLLHPSAPFPILGRVVLGHFKSMSKHIAILMDTFQELEQDTIEYMSKTYHPSIKAIGPLFRSCAAAVDTNSTTSSKEIRGDMYSADPSTIDWLDTKPRGSVVYISFGSIVHLKQEQVDEIAFGLLIAGVSFLWVVRPPPKGREKELKPHVLPEGFLEKVGDDKGKILEWAPQEAVLSHPAVACFVTHCGWNSTIEALTCGVPVVAFPQWGDQVTDAKFLVDVFKVGIRMCRGEAEGRIVPREEVATCLKAAIEEADEMKENSLRWKKAAEEAVAEGGSSYKNMQDFIDEIVGTQSE